MVLDIEKLMVNLGPIVTGSVDFKTIFDHLPIGLLATDAEGRIIYYNPQLAKIDSMDESFALGRLVTKVYDHCPLSLVMACLESGKPVIDYVCVYRTAYGKLINSSHYVFPLFSEGKVSGCLCFIQSFAALTVASPDVSDFKNLGAVKGKPVNFDKIVGRNLGLQRAIFAAKKSAQSLSPVLIYGETGTGKEMFASSIHQASGRRDKPFVAINCAAIPENLLEGILFGTTKGSFTGALEKKGLLEEAKGGTVFLDEVDSMSLSLQPKLLRVLQEKKVRRIGSAQETNLDVKIISASSVSPLLAVEHGKLRSDLFYRLGVVLINIPPLRKRIDDLEELLTFFILKYNTLLGKKVVHFSRDVIKLFRAYDWPGNIRELEHLVEGALNLAGNQEEVGLDFLPDHFQERAQMLLRKREVDASPPVRRLNDENREGTGALDEEEAARITEAMQKSFGNTTLAAKLLGISRQLLSYRLKKFNIDKRIFKL